MDQLSQETLTELKTSFEGLSKLPASDSAQNAGDTEDRLTVQFTKLQTRLDELLSEAAEGSEAYYKLIAMKHSLTYEEAKIHLSGNDTEIAQELLEKTLESLSEHKQHPQVAFLYIRIVNHLAYLLSKEGALERARNLLEEVTTNTPDDLIVFSSEELFYNRTSDETQAVSKLGKLMANNLQMLGWVYGKIGNHDLYTLKLHEALQQLLNVYDNDLVQWSCRCIRLALLFLNKCHYLAARYHLSAAGTVLDSLEATMSVHPELGKAQADLARCWIHYSLHLFGTSKKVILERMCKEADAQSSEEEAPQTVPELISPNLLFANLDVVVETVPALLTKTTEQARDLFNFAQLWLKRVRVYYTIRDHPILYVNAVLNQSELYRFLAFYEPDLDSQYRVQKLRADSLEQLSAILKEVRPKCYVAVSVELIRELAEVQIELMSLNLRKLYADGATSSSEGELKRRIQAVSDIHTKLEGVGDMLGHSSLEEEEMLEEADTGLNCNEEESSEDEENNSESETQ